MNKFDELISRALTDEDRALLARHAEPGYLSQAFGIFRGPMAGVMWLVNLASAVAVIGGVYAVWQLFDTSDPVIAIRWSVLALFLFQVTAMSKSFMGNHMQANRILRELKRLELQVSMLRGTHDAEM